MARQQPDQAAGRHDDHGGTETEVFPSANDSQLVGTPQHRAASVLSVSVMLHRARHRQHSIKNAWRGLVGEEFHRQRLLDHLNLAASPLQPPTKARRGHTENRWMMVERIDAAEIRAERVEQRLDQVLDALLSERRQQAGQGERVPWWRGWFKVR